MRSREVAWVCSTCQVGSRRGGALVRENGRRAEVDVAVVEGGEEAVEGSEVMEPAVVEDGPDPGAGSSELATEESRLEPAMARLRDRVRGGARCCKVSCGGRMRVAKVQVCCRRCDGLFHWKCAGVSRTQLLGEVRRGSRGVTGVTSK